MPTDLILTRCRCSGFILGTVCARILLFVPLRAPLLAAVCLGLALKSASLRGDRAGLPTRWVLTRTLWLCWFRYLKLDASAQIIVRSSDCAVLRLCISGAGEGCAKMGQAGPGETRRGSDPSGGGMGLFHPCVWGLVQWGFLVGVAVRGRRGHDGQRRACAVLVVLGTPCAASSILFVLPGHDSTSRMDSRRVLFVGGGAVPPCPIPTSRVTPSYSVCCNFVLFSSLLHSPGMGTGLGGVTAPPGGAVLWGSRGWCGVCKSLQCWGQQCHQGHSVQVMPPQKGQWAVRDCVISSHFTRSERTARVGSHFACWVLHTFDCFWCIGSFFYCSQGFFQRGNSIFFLFFFSLALQNHSNWREGSRRGAALGTVLREEIVIKRRRMKANSFTNVSRGGGNMEFFVTLSPPCGSSS